MKSLSRRQMLRYAGVTGAGVLVAACQPKIVEVTTVVEKEKVVKETVVQVQKEVVKETVVVTQDKVQEKVVTATPPPRKADEVVYLRYGTFWPMNRIAYMDKGLAIFHDANPKIRVSIEMGGGQYRDKITTQFAAGTEPHTGITDTYSMQRLYDLGMILDLMPAMEKAGIDVRKEYAILGHEIHGGSYLYGVPWTTYSHGLFYNKSKFKEWGVPDPNDDLGGYWSTAKFEEVLRLLKEKGGEKIFPLDADITSVDYSIPEFVYGQCGRLYDFKNMKYTYSEPNTVKALQKMVDWQKDGLIIDSESRSATALGGMLDTFSGGVAMMSKSSTGNLGPFAERIGTTFEWDIARCPTATGAPNESMSYVSSDSNFASAKGAYPDEATALLMFFAGKDMQDILSKARVGMSALKSSLSIEGGFLTPPPKGIGMMLEPWDTQRFVPRLLHYNALECTKIPTREMQYVILGEKTMEEACNVIDKDSNARVEFKTPFQPASNWLIDFPATQATCK